jgi:glycosyltransferase involved in cell wall biosynthesis
MVVYSYYQTDGRVRSYAQSLASAGVPVDVLCLRHPGEAPSAQTNGVRVITIPVSRKGGNQTSYGFEYALALVLFSLRLVQLYIRNRYQVIHTHNMPDFLILTSLIPRIFGVRLILDIHDPMPEFYLAKFRKRANRIVMGILRMQERVSIGLAHAVITANSAFKANLVRRGIPAGKITVVNNVPDPLLFDPAGYEQMRGAPREHFTLIYPGTIAPRYGLDIPIRALPALTKAIPNIRLSLVGRNTGGALELMRLAEQLAVSSFVQVVPHVPVEQIPGLLAQADVGIYPARPDPHMSIAVPCKVLEYAAMGLPIISARLKVIADEFSDGCVLFFEPENVEQFTQCVLELYRNPARRNELVRNASRDLAARRSWRTEQAKYFQLLSQLLPARSADQA